MFFQRIEDLRIDHDKTQQEIADILHCKREVYRRYEKGVREIPVWAVITLARYYNCTTDYILGLSPVKTPYPALPDKSRPKAALQQTEAGSCLYPTPQTGPETGGNIIPPPCCGCSASERI